MQLIDNKNQIARAQKIFINTLLVNGVKKYKCELGYHGGKTDLLDVFWLESEDIWVAFLVLHNRYWNAFGIGEPINYDQLGITCEINIPLQGINRRIAGAYAKDKDDSIYLLHNGRIGGSKEGIGKTLFFNNYAGKITVMDNNINYAIIGKLGDPTLKVNVANFVRQIRRMKDSIN